MLTCDPPSPFPRGESRNVGFFPPVICSVGRFERSGFPGPAGLAVGDGAGGKANPASPSSARGCCRAVRRVPAGAFALCLCLPGENKYKNNAYRRVSYINKCLGRDLAVGNLLGKSWSDGNWRVKHSSLTWMCLGFDLYF